MNHVINQAPSLQTILDEFGLVTPSKFAILPRNVFTAESTEKLLYGAETSTLRKILHKHGVEVERIESSSLKIPQIEEKSAALILPLIFVGANLLSQNPNALSVILGIISNFATDALKGIGTDQVELSIITGSHRTGHYRSIDYKGPATGLTDLIQIVKAESKNDKRN